MSRYCQLDVLQTPHVTASLTDFSRHLQSNNKQNGPHMPNIQRLLQCVTAVQREPMFSVSNTSTDLREMGSTQGQTRFCNIQHTTHAKVHY